MIRVPCSQQMEREEVSISWVATELDAAVVTSEREFLSGRLNHCQIVHPFTVHGDLLPWPQKSPIASCC